MLSKQGVNRIHAVVLTALPTESPHISRRVPQSPRTLAAGYRRAHTLGCASAPCSLRPCRCVGGTGQGLAAHFIYAKYAPFPAAPPHTFHYLTAGYRGVPRGTVRILQHVTRLMRGLQSRKALVVCRKHRSFYQRSTPPCSLRRSNPYGSIRSANSYATTVT